ncbi:VWA domain-containing protein [Sulfurovum sp.]|uniref:vWA domain-containing protein n=1 Tax=Sulfurovum sp. TaxID=1969726 RepID=UPI0025E13173|nr:VWA domain-containing protein [Sulfurovum sp.]
MTLLYPAFLWLLIPVLILFFTKKNRNLISTVHLIILILIVTALTRPVIKLGLQEQAVEAKDIIIALDVSYSMRAKDIMPTRYDFAKETIAAFLAANPKDNIMLIAFTTNPLLLSPPTTDHELVNMALKSFNPEYILTKGTSLKKLFRKIASMQSEEKNLLLITDGGEENNPEELARQIKNSGIKLTVLALGTKQGSTIETPDGTLLKDKEHHLVVSRINPMLEKLVSKTGGEYLTASSTPEATSGVLQDAMEHHRQKSELITKKQYRYSEFYQIPLLLALLLFLILHTRAVKMLLVLFSFLGIHAEASLFESYHLNQAYKSYHAEDYNRTKKLLDTLDNSSLQSQFALANTYYKLHDYQKAITLYRAIHSTSAKTKQKLYYNIANSYAMLKVYDKAKIYYTKALQLGEDADAAYNLRLVALLQKKKAPLGMAHPKSQSADGGKSESQQSDKKQNKEEAQPSSGSGSGGESKAGQKKEKKQLILDESQKKQPLSSKVYELINKGYIRETQPW